MINSSSALGIGPSALRKIERTSEVVAQFDGVSQGWDCPWFGLLAGFGFPNMLCCCRNEGSVETTYTEAEMSCAWEERTDSSTASEIA